MKNVTTRVHYGTGQYISQQLNDLVGYIAGLRSISCYVISYKADFPQTSGGNLPLDTDSL